MELEDYVIEELEIELPGEYGEENSYVINLLDSENYAKVFSLLEKNENLNLMEDNQVITNEGSSLIYMDDDYNIMINLISDWEGEIFQLIITQL